MTPAERVEVGEGGDKTLVVGVVAAVLGLQLSSQLGLAVAHSSAKTNVLPNLGGWGMNNLAFIFFLYNHRQLRRKRGCEKKRSG